MESQKYLQEFLLTFSSIDRFLFRYSDIEELDDIHPEELIMRVNACPIYLICKRPRLSLLDSTLKITNEFVHVTLEYKQAGTLHSADAQIPRNIFTADEAEFKVSPYPHRELLSFDNNGKHMGTMLLATCAQAFIGLPDEAKDLEVLYVGKGVASKAKGRLLSHSTLQKILAQVSSNEPDDEIFILLYAFDQPKKAMLNLIFPGIEPEFTGDIAKNHMRRILEYRPNLDEQIALIEASLIHYFQTAKYNTHYIHGFPGRKQKILENVYEADFAAIIIEIDNTNIAYQRIFSDKVAPHYRHLAKVDFRKLEHRKSVLEV